MPDETVVHTETQAPVTPAPVNTSVRFHKTGVGPQVVDFDAVGMTINDFFEQLGVSTEGQQPCVDGHRVDGEFVIQPGALVQLTTSPSGA